MGNLMGILDYAVMPTELPRNNMIKNFFKKFTRKLVAAPVNQSPKESATEKKEPWIAVLDTHVDKNNIRNGFFELDWNEYFVLELRNNGYTGDTEEAVVDKWFGDLCRNIGGDEGLDMDRRGSGYININALGNGKAEIS